MAQRKEPTIIEERLTAIWVCGSRLLRHAVPEKALEHSTRSLNVYENKRLIENSKGILTIFAESQTLENKLVNETLGASAGKKRKSSRTLNVYENKAA
jgi:hypothetical protein